MSRSCAGPVIDKTTAVKVRRWGEAESQLRSLASIYSPCEDTPVAGNGVEPFTRAYETLRARRSPQSTPYRIINIYRILSLSAAADSAVIKFA